MLHFCNTSIYPSKKKNYFFFVIHYKRLQWLGITSAHYRKKYVSIYLSIHMNSPTRAFLQLDSLTSLWYLLIISACFLFETLFYCWAIPNRLCMADYATALTITSWPFSILFVKIFISHVESYKAIQNLKHCKNIWKCLRGKTNQFRICFLTTGL